MKTGRSLSAEQFATLRELQNFLASPQRLCAFIAPTGFGKGVILETLIAESAPDQTFIWLCPLIALAREFEQRFIAQGIPCINSVNPDHPPLPNTFKVWLLSPEALQSENRRRHLRQWFKKFPRTSVIFDEAHCIYYWGESFRPAYLKALDFFRSDGAPKFFFTTATLPAEHLERFEKQFEQTATRVGTFRLAQNIRRIEQPCSAGHFFSLARALIARHYHDKRRLLIYSPTRTLAEKWFQYLKQNHFSSVDVYHAGFFKEERQAKEVCYHSKNAPQILISTVAFGMGVNLPGLNECLFLAPPGSLLDYVQFQGRLGRDGSPATSTLLYSEINFFQPTDLDQYLGQPSPKAKDDFLKNYFI